MHLPTLYLDTSVIGGCHDAEWQIDTLELWRQRDLGLRMFVSSGLVAQEIAGAPAVVQETFESTFDRASDLLLITEEIESLAQQYLEARVVSPKFEDDARHVAICTIHKVDHLVSWNFKHLVNVKRAAGFNGVNLLQGYGSVSMLTARELIYGNAAEEL